MEEEKEFREGARKVFERIERALDAVDPDIAECEWSQGALMVQFEDRSRVVLSLQPAVRQVWMALGGKGTAHHFQWNTDRGSWVDVANPELELTQVFFSHFREVTGLELALKSD